MNCPRSIFTVSDSSDRNRQPEAQQTATARSKAQQQKQKQQHEQELQSTPAHTRRHQAFQQQFTTPPSSLRAPTSAPAQYAPIAPDQTTSHIDQTPEPGSSIDRRTESRAAERELNIARPPEQVVGRRPVFKTREEAHADKVASTDTHHHHHHHHQHQ